MEIRHLKLIQTVASTGNLTKAASLLFLSQSALSHQLRELEEEVGAQIFVRAKKKMVLTPVGKRLLKTADQVLCELQKVQCEIDRMTNADSGTLRFTTGCYTCYHWLSPVLRAFKTKYPNVDLEIVPEATYNSFEYLLDGRVDLVFTSDKLDNPHIYFHPLFEDEMVAVVAPNHPWANRKRIFPRDFKQEPIIMYDVPEPNSTVLNDFFKPAGIWPHKIIRLKLTEAVIEMTKAEMGVAILAEWATRPHVERAEVVTIPLGRKIKRTWYVTTLKNLNQPAFMQEFIHKLEAALSERLSIL